MVSWAVQGGVREGAPEPTSCAGSICHPGTCLQHGAGHGDPAQGPAVASLCFQLQEPAWAPPEPQPRMVGWQRPGAGAGPELCRAGEKSPLRTRAVPRGVRKRWWGLAGRAPRPLCSTAGGKPSSCKVTEQGVRKQYAVFSQRDPTVSDNVTEPSSRRKSPALLLQQANHTKPEVLVNEELMGENTNFDQTPVTSRVSKPIMSHRPQPPLSQHNRLEGCWCCSGSGGTGAPPAQPEGQRLLFVLSIFPSPTHV